MKSIQFIFVLFFLSYFANYANAQKYYNKKDTLYYLVDTLHTPKNDRMLEFNSYLRHQFYTINCPCLNNNTKPQFRTNVNNKININSEYTLLKFISLSGLIDFVKKNDTDDFDERHVIYFIENNGAQYTKNRAYFMGSKKTITN